MIVAPGFKGPGIFSLTQAPPFTEYLTSKLLIAVSFKFFTRTCICTELPSSEIVNLRPVLGVSRESSLRSPSEIFPPQPPVTGLREMALDLRPELPLNLALAATQ